MNDSPYRIQPGSSALVMVDFQRDILIEEGESVHKWARGAVETGARLVAWCRPRGVPVIWVRVIRRSDYLDVFPHATDARLRAPTSAQRRLLEGSKGVELVPQLQPGHDDFHVVKTRVDAFYATHLDVYLRRLAVETLLIGGVYTHMGVEATVRGAYDRDFNTVVVSDACASPSQSLHAHAVERILPSMAVVRKFLDLEASVRSDASAAAQDET